MSHTAYPNSYQPPQPQFSSFQLPQHAGYTPNTNSTQYPNHYVDVSQQRTLPPSWTDAPQNVQNRPTTPQFQRPSSAQAQYMDMTSPPHSPVRPQTTQGFDTVQQMDLGYLQHHGARPTPSKRAEFVFSQHNQQEYLTNSSIATQQSPPRRPLPTPHARPVTNPIPDKRPLPSAYQASPSMPSTPFHRPSYSTSTTATTSPSVSPPSNMPNTGSTFSTRSSRPLPTPIPRATKSVDLTHSPSPMKNISNTTSPLPPPGQKFVPLWKRSLPTAPAQSSNPSSPVFGKLPSVPGQPPSFMDIGTSGFSLQRNGSAVRPLPPSPVQAYTPNYGTPQHSPTKAAFSREGSMDGTPASSPVKTSSGFLVYERHRVLPEIPNGTHSRRPSTETSYHSSMPAAASRQQYHSGLPDSPPRQTHSPQSSESEDMYENSLLRRPPNSVMVRPPSPSFGSRDPPSRSSFEHNQRPPEREISQPSSGNRTGRRMSIVSRIAEMSLNGSSPDLSIKDPSSSPGGSPTRRNHPMPLVGRASTQPSAPRWPSELPPLPRTPQIQSEHGHSQVVRSPPTHFQAFQAIKPEASPTRVQFPPMKQRDPSPARNQPPPSQLSMTSPTRSRFLPQVRSHDPSPSRSTSQAPLGSLPQSDPTTPTRSRFPPQAPQRDPALPAPQAQRMFPNLDDAPPPSLRRSPSPIRASTLPYPSGSNGLPAIRTQGVGNMEFGLGSTVVSPPSAVTPSSAGSVFSLSSFPAPPEMSPQWQADARANGRESNSRSREMSPNRRGIPTIVKPQHDTWDDGPAISVSGPTHGHEGRVPKISFPVMDDDDDDTVQLPMISVGSAGDNLPQISVSGGGGPPAPRRINNPVHPLPTVRNKGGLFCGGCGAAILGRSINTMGANWHPGCFRCAACDQLLENLAMFEHEHRLYCSLCYYEVDVSLALSFFMVLLNDIAELRAEVLPLPNSDCGPGLHYPL